MSQLIIIFICLFCICCKIFLGCNIVKWIDLIVGERRRTSQLVNGLGKFHLRLPS